MRVHFIQHVSFEHPGYLLEWAQDRQCSITFTKVFEKAFFPSANDFDLLIIMGGPMGVYEEKKFSWLKKEKQFIKNAIEADKKVLGICLGSQLVAEALGAKVYPNKEKEIGWWPVKKISSENAASLTAAFPDEFITFHWHGDTFDLPKNSTRIFATDVCPNQGFLHGTRVAGLQFHPEVTTALVAAMVEHEKEELVVARFIQTEEEIKNETPNRVEQNKTFTNAFVNHFLVL
ncbi:MAG: type 1 glutamine amidotransferase [Chitinophagales bacterium]